MRYRARQPMMRERKGALPATRGPSEFGADTDCRDASGACVTIHGITTDPFVELESLFRDTMGAGKFNDWSKHSTTTRPQLLSDAQYST